MLGLVEQGLLVPFLAGLRMSITTDRSAGYSLPRPSRLQARHFKQKSQKKEGKEKKDSRMPPILIPMHVSPAPPPRMIILIPLAILPRTENLHRRLRDHFLALLAGGRSVAPLVGDIACAAPASGRGLAFGALAHDAAVDVGCGVGANVARACERDGQSSLDKLNMGRGKDNRRGLCCGLDSLTSRCGLCDCRFPPSR